ncbi:MAG: response regulator [Alphaproteobacteria bacterium]|nr:response regulator [Alphaproteobacteria bacterium]
MLDDLYAICSTMRVLVIDDDKDIVDVVKLVLKDLKVQTVWTAADGALGLDIFRQVRNKVDLIICDWMMPGMDGIEFLGHVRELNTTVPFLMLTAKGTPKAIVAARKSGVDAYVVKPFELLDLKKKILALVKARHPELTPQGK